MRSKTPSVTVLVGFLGREASFLIDFFDQSPSFPVYVSFDVYIKDAEVDVWGSDVELVHSAIAAPHPATPRT